MTHAEIAAFIAANENIITLFLAAAVAAGLGAFCGAGAVLDKERAEARQDVLGVVNVSIASMIALLGKLLNFKKDLAFPAEEDAQKLEQDIAGMQAGGEKSAVSIRMEMWPEFAFTSGLSHEKLATCCGRELDVIQLSRMLEYNLTELSHLIKQRNTLIAQINRASNQNGLPLDGVKLYIRYAGLIARNVDENLFFLDRAIEKVQAAAKQSLPARLHGRVADVSFRQEAQPLIPAKNFIKGWVK